MRAILTRHRSGLPITQRRSTPSGRLAPDCVDWSAVPKVSAEIAKAHADHRAGPAVCQILTGRWNRSRLARARPATRT